MDIETDVAAGKGRFYIQWKGTDVCFDFTCSCGAEGHFDGYFAYLVKCPSCDAHYEMPDTLMVASTEHPSFDWTPVVPTLDEDL